MNDNVKLNLIEIGAAEFFGVVEEPGVIGQLRSDDQSSLPTQFLQTNSPSGSYLYLIAFNWL